jgi:hypothetical protein
MSRQHLGEVQAGEICEHGRGQKPMAETGNVEVAGKQKSRRNERLILLSKAVCGSYGRGIIRGEALVRHFGMSKIGNRHNHQQQGDS